MSENLSLIPEASAAQPDSLNKLFMKSVCRGSWLCSHCHRCQLIQCVFLQILNNADKGRGLSRQRPQLPLYRCCCALTVTDKVWGHLRLLENTQDTQIDEMLSIFNLYCSLHWPLENIEMLVRFGWLTRAK